MAKYSFKNYESVVYRLDFTSGFELFVTYGDIDGRHLKHRSFWFKTALGLAKAERALKEENPHARHDGYWADARSGERQKLYSRAYNEVEFGGHLGER